jgi:succinate dehydrogenase/fumarate reductase flavoprotein subunit
MAPAFGAQTKGRMYQFARYYHADGTPLSVPPGFAGRHAVPRAMLTEPVFARLDLAPPELHESLRWAQPNFFLPYDRAGIDVFRDLFEVRMVMEGTVRGTGGLALSGDGCETTVPGLYAAGDVATRELITGGRSGGGSHNGAWAISSGTIAGATAARFARRLRGTVTPAGRHGLLPGSTSADAVIHAVQNEVLPLDRNLFRTGAGLRDSLARLDELWADAVPALDAAANPQRAREAVAMVAHARWMYRAAEARTESRAMHRREDHPDTAPAWAHRLRVGGLDEVWVEAEGAAPVTRTAVEELAS